MSTDDNTIEYIPAQERLVEPSACPSQEASESEHRLQKLIKEGERFCEESVPIILLQPGNKRPLSRPKEKPDDIGVYIIDDPFDVEPQVRNHAAQHGDLNLGFMVGFAKLSPVLAVGLDIYKENGAAAHQWAKNVGVSSLDDVWIMHTGRGGITIIYYQPLGLELKRVIEPRGIPIDLLVNGFQVAPPSDTFSLPDGGGPYRWFPGHSPADIHVTDLMEPPDALIEYWQAQTEERAIFPDSENGQNSGKAWTLLNAPIPCGSRNDTLTRIAGWMTLYHPAPVVETLLLVINDGRCDPPLPEHEVRSIAQSVGRYPRQGVNGHPAAVVPSFVREQ